MPSASAVSLPSFQSTLSMRRATLRFLSNEVNSFSISIHALHEESDTALYASDIRINISIHALHEESDRPVRQQPHRATISIHALHEESDGSPYFVECLIDISIHALHEESDWSQFTAFLGNCVFQSTLSMRRATVLPDTFTVVLDISIHALHEESD